MKTKTVIKVIRILFSFWLIYGAYTETGIYTALCLSLILVYVEANTQINEAQSELNNAFEKSIAQLYGEDLIAELDDFEKKIGE